MSSDEISQGRILIVDDDEDIGRLYETWLAQNGYLPVCMTRPREALNRIEQEEFDLLLVDMTMPEMDGLELLRAAKSIRPDLPAIAITAHSALNHAIESLEVGASAFLLKPITEEELLHGVGDVLERDRLMEENLRLKVLMPLYEVSESLILSTNMSTLLGQVVGVAASETDSDRVTLMLKDAETSRLSVKVAYPSLPPTAKGRASFLDAVLEVGYATLSAQAPLIRRNKNEVRTHHPLLCDPTSNGDAVASFMSIPLMHMGECRGVLGLFRREEDNTYNQGDLEMAHILAGQVAVAIENVALFLDLSASHFETLKVLAQLIEAKDHYTRGHCDRLVTYVMALAERMALTDEEKQYLGYGAALHDIGKIGVHALILNKPDKLTNQEFEGVKAHPAMGAEIVKGIEFLNPVIPIIYYHQEFYDGKGYPEGRVGEEIPLGARMVAVVDTFDAMTSDRPYRKALPFEVAFAELRRCAGTQFDPRIVEDFIATLQPETQR